jgi:hypothetical protein
MSPTPTLNIYLFEGPIVIHKMLKLQKDFVNLEFNETMAKTAFLDPRFIERAFSFESALQKKKKNKI